MKQIKAVLSFVWPYSAPYRGTFILGILFSFIFALTNGLLLLGMKTVFDRLEGRLAEPVSVNENATWLERVDALKTEVQYNIGSLLPEAGQPLDTSAAWILFLILVGTSAIRGASNYLSSYFMRWNSEFTIRDIKRSMLAKVQSLSLDYFNQSALGDLLTRIDIDTAALNKAWGLALTDLIRQPLTFGITLGAVISLVDYRLTLMALIFFPVCVVPVILLGRRVRRHTRRSRESGVEQASRLIDFFSHIRTVKAYGMESLQAEEYDHTSLRIARANLKRDNAFTLVNPIIETVAALGFCVVLLAAFSLGSSMSHLAVFLAGFFLAYTPLKRLAAVNHNFQEASISVDRLDRVLSLQPTVRDHHQGKTIQGLNHQLTLSGVTFRYSPETEPVLSEINLNIARGEFVGLAGSSGSGKSTLIHLIMRFYDPTTGVVKWDGTDLREISITSLRRQIALVSQDVAIFDRSVRDNILFGRPGATEAEIRKAAEFASADEFIREMPEGYETLLGEQGVRLSGGQKQRISLARAFLRRAPLLILDEATAALDSVSESRIQEVINRLSSDRSVIAIAHRLATLNRADRIVVLDRGQISETGSYAELLSRGGSFSQLAALQGIRS
ncbi:MAG: ABC transporter ATP-binding protein [Candidatus Methylacidiphilales bacterium]